MNFGYCRVSTENQKLKRQEDSIKQYAPDAIIYKEKYTGTKLDRPEFQKMLRKLKQGDTVYFDDVDRMARCAEEGFQLYKQLFEQGVNLVFIHSPAVNTEIFRSTQQLMLTGNDIDVILEGVNKYLWILAEKQIKAAFSQAQAEADHIHQRTKDGMAAAEAGKKISAARKDKTYETGKSKEAKEKILKHSVSFGGSLNDTDMMVLAGISRNSLKKYKAELEAEQAKEAV